MRNINDLIIEFAIIGITTIIFNLIIYRILVGNFPKKENSQIMIFGAFLIGVFIHMFFELTGINELWCRRTFV